ncbi:MAG: hypothetical protein PHV49_03315 [Alistipes sp.]|nr:hypothetical protein [Alistipes sp.]
MDCKNDYTRRTFMITALVVVILVGISQIPRFKVGDLSLKKINILSDLFKEDFYPSPEENLYFDTTFLAEGEALEAEAQQSEAIGQSMSSVSMAPSLSPAVGLLTASASDSALKIVQSTVHPEYQATSLSDPSAANAGYTEGPLMEDFGASESALARFYQKLSSEERQRPIRIAVLGDSFIEGDILTADLREQLQDLYGGNGVGFVPFASPIAKFRGTVQHTFGGWRTLDVKSARTAPEEYRDRFFVSGNLSIPEENAWVQLRGVTFRKHIQRASSARLLFTNRDSTALNVTVNDTLQLHFTPESGPQVQQIEIQQPVQSLRVALSQSAGFIGYGVVLEDNKGVSVDNFSVRGNSSLALFATEQNINAQIGKMRQYDLVILQYGLNVMSVDVLRYDSYAKAFIKVINYMKRCFPGSSILVMGVCDRSMQRDGEFVTMPSVQGMIAAQRYAAEQTGVAFWNTFLAMGGSNSMASFVAKHWAAKDYTHIGYAGGKYIASKLVKSLLQGAETAKKEKKESLRREMEQMLHYNQTSNPEVSLLK